MNRLAKGLRSRWRRFLSCARLNPTKRSKARCVLTSSSIAWLPQRSHEDGGGGAGRVGERGFGARAERDLGAGAAEDPYRGDAAGRDAEGAPGANEALVDWVSGELDRAAAAKPIRGGLRRIV